MSSFVENVNKIASGLTQPLDKTISALVAVDATKVDKVPGKQLSTEDYSTIEKNKLAALDSSQYEKIVNKGQPNGYPSLDSNGKIPSSFLSSLNTVDVYTPVDEASMLLINANPGDIAYRQDNDNAYMLVALPASTLANWLQLNIAGVSSWNGQIGVINASTDDLPEGLANLYFTDERVDDRVASLLVAGSKIQIVYDDVFNTLTLSTTAAEINDSTPSLTTVYSSSKTQELHDAQAIAIANLASSSGSIVNQVTPAIASITTTPQDFAFTIQTPVSDPSVFTFDDALNQITFLKDGNYNFFSIVEIGSTSNTSRVVTFDIVDVSTNTVIKTQDAIVDIPINSTDNYPLNTLLTVGSNGIPSAPLTIKFKVQMDAGSDKSFNRFSSILARASVANEITVASTDAALGIIYEGLA